MDVNDSNTLTFNKKQKLGKSNITFRYWSFLYEKLHNFIIIKFLERNLQNFGHNKLKKMNSLILSMVLI